MMTIAAIRLLRRGPGPWLGAAVLALAGCATDGGLVAPEGPARAKGADVAAPAATAPAAGYFSGALRCMDTLLLDHGARDLSVIVEDLADKTQRGNAGSKDTLISTVSDMTRRSQAIRLVASGQDWSRTLDVMAQAAKREAYALPPQYSLRGSIRTLVASAGVTTFGIDLSLLNTQDMSIVPGTATHNVLTLRQRAGAADGQAELRKFGQQFSFASSDRDPSAAAVRSLVELATIELFGRLARVPYWNCLGVTDADADVGAEIQDWYDAMAARPAELVRYFQRQLRQRRAYDGPIDGSVNAEFKDAVAGYRESLGLSREARLTLDFYKAYLAADHGQLVPRIRPAVAAAAPAGGPATPLSLRVSSLNDIQRFARGEAVQLTIRPSRAAHVYCFLQDEKRQITRFFPNRFQRDSRVQPAAALRLPGAMGFEIVMNPRGVAETVACFATERDVLPELPSGLNGGDFHPLPVASLEQLRQAFAKASPTVLAQDSFQIRPR
jgi:hypothetical protein